MLTSPRLSIRMSTLQSHEDFFASERFDDSVMDPSSSASGGARRSNVWNGRAPIIGAPQRPEAAVLRESVLNGTLILGSARTPAVPALFILNPGSVSVTSNMKKPNEIRFFWRMELEMAMSTARTIAIGVCPPG
jgi:hypothetical protein